MSFFATFLTSMFSALGTFFLQREAVQKNDAAQRELERLQLQNNALKTEQAQTTAREATTNEVARLSTTDLFKQLRQP